MRKITRLLAFFCALTLLFSYSVMISAAENDANENINSLSETAEIPNLFRQNGVYSNVENTPLVVKDGVEYVPISVFSLYPYVDVEYSKTDENFFLVNTKNNHYISFNTEQQLASTHDGDLLTMPVEVFNQTRYVPAKTVGVVLGFTCETYEDPENDIYAFRVSDGKTDQSLEDMVTAYVVEKPAEPSKDDKKTPTTEKPAEPQKEEKEYVGNEIFKQGDTANLIFPESPPSSKDDKQEHGDEKDPEDKTDAQLKEDGNEPEQEKKPQDEAEKTEKRSIGLCFMQFSAAETGRIIDTLNSRKIKASFILTKEDILASPVNVRRALVSDYGLILTTVAQGSDVKEYTESFISGLEEANQALKLISKNKTRMCMLPDDIPPEIRDDEYFIERIAQAGYLVFTPNFDAGDTSEFNGSAYTISANIKKHVTEDIEPDEIGVVTSVMRCSNKTYYYLLDLAGFVNQHEQIEFFAVNESFLFNN